MNINSKTGAALILGFAFATSSCTMPVSDAGTELGESEVDSVEQSVVDGTVTFARPDVGGQGCTFTMITNWLFLTAAHCAHSKALNILPPAGQSGAEYIWFQLSETEKFVPAIERTYAFSTLPLNSFAHGSDIAVGRLQQPYNGVTPATMQTVLPAPGSPVTLVGNGCPPGPPVPDMVKKTYREGTFTPVNFGCEGDSGGPLFVGNLAANGPMVSVNSGSSVYSHIGHHSERIAATIRSMSSGSEPGFDRPGTAFATAITPFSLSCAALCDQDARCRAYTFHSPSKVCSLKAAMFPMTPSANHISGVPGIFGGIAVDYPGNDIAPSPITNSSADACRGHCAQRSDCGAYTFVGGNCWLKSAAAPAQACSTCKSGIRRGLEVGFDRPGGDLSQVNSVNDAKTCAAWCEVVDTCRAFTFVPSQSRCYLKSSVPGPTSSAATATFVSGVKRGLEVNVNRNGNDIDSFPLLEAYPQICQAACWAKPGCSSWTMTLEQPAAPAFFSAACWLKSGFPAPSHLDGAVSGTNGGDFF